jgi:hypothetical protein
MYVCFVCDDNRYGAEVSMPNFAVVAGGGFASPRIGISSIKSLLVNNV